MYRTGYRLLFWGSLLLLVDIKIMRFDLFGDIIGYILISVGLHRLSAQHVEYQKATPWSWLLVVLSVFTLGDTYVNQTAAQPGSPLSLFSLMLSQGIIIVHTVLIYRICTAIHLLAIEKYEYGLSDAAAFRRKALLISTAAILSVMPFILTMTTTATLVLLPLAIINIFVTILILLLIRRAGKALTAV